ncbi:hypothetical protein LIER_24998 [Lithospermum erythrorhizon]|uniref:Reverse transcriptase domain-containing protein n=1 Tax=Lithospermum erythrorhizon TaxID=34254 RepID=A0AAV3R915_LITER
MRLHQAQNKITSIRDGNGRLVEDLKSEQHYNHLHSKGAATSTMKEFRPIACGNTVYKCIATILANRLKTTFSTLIGEQQTVYMPGKNIANGILLM